VHKLVFITEMYRDARSKQTLPMVVNEFLPYFPHLLTDFDKIQYSGFILGVLR